MCRMRLFAHWISILWSVNGTSMCHYSAFAGMTNEGDARITLPLVMPGLPSLLVMPGLTRHPVKHTSRRDTFN